ncbi:Ribosomal RNA small subunit methyltransferase I [Methylophilaceae bacterium]|nr:Ribosomal RNA small subunit methyltransferase I [Methylophilaceae bacterium]
MPHGTLYLIPVTLGDDHFAGVLPVQVVDVARRLDTFVVENEKSARRFLGSIKTIKPVRELVLLTLNEHTAEKDIPALLEPLLSGKDVGVMSEAGCPGIADPGAKLVALAHRKGIQVKPLVGPSSILLALIASGLDGQRFSFLGYLPAEKSARILKLKEIENRSAKAGETQIFIETPYRNQHLLEDLVVHCHDQTRLCVASNLTLENELIQSRSVAEWRKSTLPNLHKQPTVFLLLAS